MSRPLIPGFPWSIELQHTTDPVQSPAAVFFPPGCQLRASVRALARTIPNPPVLTTLTTAAGTIVVQDPQTIVVSIPVSVSREWTALTHVMFDVIRTDVVPDQHLGYRVEIPIVRSLTETTEPA